MGRTRSRKIYLAGPLFTQAEWQWNEKLALELARYAFEIVLPQRACEPMLLDPPKFNARTLFDGNVHSIDSADAVVAILDGADVDSGTAWECGYAYKANIPVVGVRTDIRTAGDDPEVGTNLMISMCCSSFVTVPGSNRRDPSLIAQAVSAALEQLATKHSG